MIYSFIERLYPEQHHHLATMHLLKTPLMILYSALELLLLLYILYPSYFIS